MRVAFTLIGGYGWTGGVNFLANLLSALYEAPECGIEPLLFLGPRASASLGRALTEFSTEPTRVSRLWEKGSVLSLTGKGLALTLGRNFFTEKAFRRNKVDLVFHHGELYGARFGLPSLDWLGDLQHRRLPEMFSRTQYARREMRFRYSVRAATTVLVMSEEGKKDCERFYPRAKDKTAVLPFVPRIPAGAWDVDVSTVVKKHGIPNKYLFLPNQFWRHKNHLRVLYALSALKRRGLMVPLVLSGSRKNHLHPEYPDAVVTEISRLGLAEQVYLVGFIPYDEIYALMRGSVSVVNPSLHEGWSSTVEEAKAIGVPLLLSDIPVHREQNPPNALFFPPSDVAAMVSVIEAAWTLWGQRPHLDLEVAARAEFSTRRSSFANAFAKIAEETVARFHT